LRSPLPTAASSELVSNISSWLYIPTSSQCLMKTYRGFPLLAMQPNHGWFT
jgi:hypothetical protein